MMTIKPLKIANLKTCKDCRWWQDEVCCNADSPHCTDFRLKDDGCDEWRFAIDRMSKQGHWEDSYEPTWQRCSVCGNAVKKSAIWWVKAAEDGNLNYCPHCGARMTEAGKGMPDRENIVRCKDCIYYNSEPDCHGDYCDKIHWSKGPDWFCADGVRR